MQWNIIHLKKPYMAVQNHGVFRKPIGSAYWVAGSWALLASYSSRGVWTICSAAMPCLSACFIGHCVFCGIKQANNFQLCVTNENLWEVCDTLSLQVINDSCSRVHFSGAVCNSECFPGEAVLNIVIWFQTLVLKNLFNPQHSWSLHSSHGIERKTQLLEHWASASKKKALQMS